ncbi:TlpA disulfide reductase family protein [Stenotrophomonas maltophilia]|uniref:Redoxin n=1 Tax=Stenotrophomonas maltophilia TaxID=40324 RepID=A0A246ID74_STEMA|nr:TlpA disulfide reductase family protein [Stenotrophomonas maltophilia]OWQ77971.1 redoxin [Stenotrophomonas maltophilia]
MNSLGPFSIDVLTLMLCAMAAWWVARRWRKGQNPEEAKRAAGIVVDAIGAGLLAARLGFVVQNWQDYASHPWSIVTLGDGGYSWTWGMLVGALVAGWLARGKVGVRRRALVGLAFGGVAWLAISFSSDWMSRTAPRVEAVHGNPLGPAVPPLSAAEGRPVVVNLWAAWCPPCRREMPAFAEAEAQLPGVVFVMVNQGDEPSTALAFIQDNDLAFDHTYADPSSETMLRFGARVMPTTLFFDSQGRMVDMHVGEMTLAGLKAKVRQHFGAESGRGALK